MTYSALGVPSTQTLPLVKDSVSKAVKTQDGFTYCGAREYSITTNSSSNYSNVLGLNTTTNILTLGLPETALKHIDDYIIEIMVKLKDYPTVFATKTFTAHVTDCVVISVNKTVVDDQFYNVYTPQIQF